MVEQEDPSVRPALLDAKTFLVYQRQLNNLTLQENRLLRQREKDIAELKQLQADREAAHKKRFDAGINAYYRSMFHARDFDFSTIGFEFAAEEFVNEIATWGPYGRTKLNTLIEEEDRLTRAFIYLEDPIAA